MSGKSPYRKLPGRRLLSLSSVPSLWLGPDHLLLVARTHFTERYKRFYLQDIQAVLVRRTNGFLVANLILGALAAASFLPWVVSGGEVVGGVFTASPFLLLLLVNILRGPTCDTRLVTAVQTVELPSLGRLRAARRFLRRVEPLVERVQGSLAAADVPSASPATPPRLPPPVEGPAAAVHSGGRVHLALFSLLAVNGILGLAVRPRGAVAFGWPGLALFTGIFALTVAALILQRGTDVTRTVRHLVWSAAGYCAMWAAAGYVLFLATFVGIQTAPPGRNPWEVIGEMGRHTPPGWSALGLPGALLALVLGLGGLVALWSFLRRHQLPPPLPVGPRGPAPPPETPWSP